MNEFMQSWWDALDFELQVFYGIGIISLFSLCIQILLSFFMGMDDGIGDASHSSGLSIFSIRGVTAFFLGFGWTGVICTKAGLGLPLTLLIAVAVGGALMVVIFLLMLSFLRMQASGALDYANAVGYIDALGQEAASKAIAEAKIKVAMADRDGEIGAAAAQRDKRISVAAANAEATGGENTALIEIANSNAQRRSAQAEADRHATAAEKVASAKVLEEAYVSEKQAELQRAERDKASQFADIVVPAQVAKERQIVEADAEAERVRRIQQGQADAVRAQKQAEADGIRFVKEAEAGGLKAKLLAEAEGAQAVLTGKAKGFENLISSCQGPGGAQHMLVTELLPQLVREQVQAIANLKIDKITVWDSGRNDDGKSSTAGFLAGMAGAVPPLHEIAKNVGVELPTYLGKLNPASPGDKSATHQEQSADH